MGLGGFCDVPGEPRERKLNPITGILLLANKFFVGGLTYEMSPS